MEWKKAAAAAAAYDQQKNFAFQSLLASSYGFPYASPNQPERDVAYFASTTTPAEAAAATTTTTTTTTAPSASAEDLLFFNTETQQDMVDPSGSYSHGLDSQQLIRFQENADAPGTSSAGYSISEILNKSKTEDPNLTFTINSLSGPDAAARIATLSSPTTYPPAIAAAQSQCLASSQSPSHRDCRKLCAIQGCTSQARAFQRCKKHGGSKRCTFSGCTKSIQSRGLCIRHGGGSRCQEPGCLRAAQSAGRCKNHGGGRLCIVSGCDKKAHLRRLCRRHGGGAKCSVDECQKWAQRQGMCMTHAKQAMNTAMPPLEQVV